MPKLGMDATLRRREESLEDAPDIDLHESTWHIVDNVRDLTLNLETGESDVTTRANNGWKQTLSTLKDGTVEFEMVWDAEDGNFIAIREAWENSSPIVMAVLDGPINSLDPPTSGLVGAFSVTNFSRSEPLEDAIKVSVTIKPSSNTRWSDDTAND